MFGRGDKAGKVSLGKGVADDAEPVIATRTAAKVPVMDDRPDDELGAYPENVDDQPSYARAIERTLRIVGLVAVVSGLINVALIMLIITILPLQKVYPFLVTFKSQENQVVSIEPLNADPQTMRYATEDNVRDYIVQRHKVTPDNAIMNAQWGPQSRIAARSSLETYTAFRQASDTELKQLVSQNYSRDVELNSVTLLPGGTWQVAFTTIDHSAGSAIAAPASGTFGASADANQPGIVQTGESRQTWVATLRAKYDPTRVRYDQRLLNPLGFTVTDYSVTRRS